MAKGIALAVLICWTFSLSAQKPDQRASNQSSASSELTIQERDRIALPTPANVKVQVSDGKAVLSWDTTRVKRVVGYEVSRRKGNGPLMSLRTVPGPPFTDDAVSGPGQFEYTVVAVDYRGNKSEASPPVKVRLHPDKGQN